MISRSHAFKNPVADAGRFLRQRSLQLVWGLKAGDQFSSVKPMCEVMLFHEVLASMVMNKRAATNRNKRQETRKNTNQKILQQKTNTDPENPKQQTTPFSDSERSFRLVALESWLGPSSYMGLWSLGEVQQQDVSNCFDVFFFFFFQ